jgi:hypothetical protein
MRTECVVTGVCGINATSQSLRPEEGTATRARVRDFYSTRADGIPFDVSKNVTLLALRSAGQQRLSVLVPVTAGISTRSKKREGQADRQLLHASGRSSPVSMPGPSTTRTMVPVYRFWSETYTSHFYTIKETEKNKLINSFSNVWTYEGVAFYAYAPNHAPADFSPVFRFLKSDGSHFYTINPAEKDKLITQFPNIYTFEGIAFYAWQ